jgi:hypothetical protein
MDTNKPEKDHQMKSKEQHPGHIAGIAAYYDRKRREAIQATDELREAIDRKADADTIRALCERLEAARYTGD